MRHLILTSFLVIGLHSIAQTSIHIDTVLKQLQLEKTNIKLDLVASKKRPNNLDETIICIPEIVKEDEHYFELNSHIVIVNSQTGEIQSKFYESSKTNEWYSDAIRLEEISIDTAPYTIQTNNRAFGVKVRYVGSSQANPYEKQTISLFIQKENKLQRVVKNLTIKQYNGEWDTDCAGEFTEVNKILIMKKNMTNEYYDILVKTKTSNSTAYIDKQNKCDEIEKISRKTEVLKYENGFYK